jgi:hypothetical protein
VYRVALVVAPAELLRKEDDDSPGLLQKGVADSPGLLRKGVAESPGFLCLEAVAYCR